MAALLRRQLGCVRVTRMSMVLARLITVIPLVLGGAVHAQSTGNLSPSLETCSESARREDLVCRGLNDPQQRLNCFNSVSAAQLACLDRTQTEARAPSQEPSGTASPSPTSNAAPDVQSGSVSSGAVAKSNPGAAAEKPLDEQAAKPARPAEAKENVIREQKSVAAQPDERPAEPASTASLPKPPKTANRKGALLCMTFRTYDATTGTYRAYDGRVRECGRVEGKLVVK